MSDCLECDEVFNRDTSRLNDLRARLETARAALKEAGHGCDCPQENRRSLPWEQHDRDCVRFVCEQALAATETEP